MILHLPIEPMGCPRPRATIRGKRAGMFMPKKYTDWQTRCARAFTQRLTIPAREGRLDWLARGRISIVAVFPRTATKPKGVETPEWNGGGRLPFYNFDADNICKAVMDALQVSIRTDLGLKWDDKRLTIGGVDRWYAAVGDEPHIRVVLEKLEGA